MICLMPLLIHCPFQFCGELVLDENLIVIQSLNLNFLLNFYSLIGLGHDLIKKLSTSLFPNAKHKADVFS